MGVSLGHGSMQKNQLMFHERQYVDVKTVRFVHIKMTPGKTSVSLRQKDVRLKRPVKLHIHMLQFL